MLTSMPPFPSTLHSQIWLAPLEKVSVGPTCRGGVRGQVRSQDYSSKNTPKIKMKTYWALLPSFSLPFIFYILNPHLGFSGQSKLGFGRAGLRRGAEWDLPTLNSTLSFLEDSQIHCWLRSLPLWIYKPSTQKAVLHSPHCPSKPQHKAVRRPRPKEIW